MLKYLQYFNDHRKIIDEMNCDIQRKLEKIKPVYTNYLVPFSFIPKISIFDIKEKFGDIFYKLLYPVNGTPVKNKIFSDNNHYANPSLAPCGPVVWKYIGHKPPEGSTIYWYPKEKIFDNLTQEHILQTVRGKRNRLDHPEIIKDLYKFRNQINEGISLYQTNSVKIKIASPILLQIAIKCNFSDKFIYYLEKEINTIYLLKNDQRITYIKLKINLHNIDLKINLPNFPSFEFDIPISLLYGEKQEKQIKIYEQQSAGSENYVAYFLNLKDIVVHSDIIKGMTYIVKTIKSSEHILAEMKYKYASKLMAKGHF